MLEGNPSLGPVEVIHENYLAIENKISVNITACTGYRHMWALYLSIYTKYRKPCIKRWLKNQSVNQASKHK